MMPVELVNYWFTPFPGRFESDDTVYKTKHDTLCDAFMVASNGIGGGTVKDLEAHVFWHLSRRDDLQLMSREELKIYQELRREEDRKRYEANRRNW